MSGRLRCFIVAIAAFVLGALGGFIGPAHEALASEQSTLQVTPNEIVNGAAFSLAFSEPQFCPGDSNKGYLWQTFITPVASDPATLTYAIGLPQGERFTSALRDTTGSWIRNENPGLTDGLVVPPRAVSFEGRAFDGLTTGEYWIGIACTRQGVDNVTRTIRVWSTRVSVTRAQSGSKRTLRIEAPVAPAGATGTSGAGSSGEVTETSVPLSEPTVVTTSPEPSPSETAPSEVMTDEASFATDTTAVAPATAGRDSGGNWWWLLWILLAAVAVRVGYLLLTRRIKGSAT